MKAVVIVLLALLPIAGCRTSHGASSDPQPKIKQLLSRKDDLALVEHYDMGTFEEDKIPDKDYGYGVKSIFFPGRVAIEPLVITDLQTRDKLKGAAVQLRGAGSQGFDGLAKPEIHGGKKREALLDVDELRDLVHAIETSRSTAAEWQKNKPDHYRKLLYQTKDGLHVSLEQDGSTEPKMFIASNDESDVIIEVPLTRAGDLLKTATDALRTLETK